MTDATVTPEHVKAAREAVGTYLKHGPGGTDNLVAQALANEREAGRREGREQAAQWHDKEADALLATATPERSTGHIVCMRQQASVHTRFAKAIRALELPPTTKTNGRYGLDENGS